MNEALGRARLQSCRYGSKGKSRGFSPKESGRIGNRLLGGAALQRCDSVHIQVKPGFSP
jgi:hypothetical protein